MFLPDTIPDARVIVTRGDFTKGKSRKGEVRKGESGVLEALILFLAADI